MHLVSALASGIAGAENGQATFTFRGTGTPTTVFRDFEGQDPVSSGDAVDLDANGGAEVYVDVLATVTVKSSIGTTVREFVAGYSSPGIELRSQSFTGQAYDDGSGQTITGTAQPTTIQSAMDKWLDTNGAVDWQILDADGNVSSIPDALSGATGLFINPRSSEYGAEGDGVNNDLPALDAATADAALIDGTIVLPHGTYRIVDTWVIPSNVSIFGLGATSVAVAIDNAADANAVSVTAPTLQDVFRTQFIEGFRIEAQQANAGVGLLLDGPATVLKDISIGSLNSFMTGHSIGLTGVVGDFVHMDNVRVDHHGLTSQLVDAPDANWQGILRASKCYFRYTGSVVDSRGIEMHSGNVSESTFDNSSVATGSTVSNVHATGDDSTVAVQGCKFIAGGDSDLVTPMRTAPFLPLVTGTFHESDNIYVGEFDFQASIGFANRSQAIVLSARHRRDTDLVSTGAGAGVFDGTGFDSQYVERQTTGNWSFGFTNDGNEGYVFTTIVRNNAGGNINVTPDNGTNSFTIADGKVGVFQHISMDIGGTKRWWPLAEPYESTF
ncbi:MAG: glycosyl hydrolase family 28-related protein [Planctomycetota bacterium]